jgi:hypothetical protein
MFSCFRIWWPVAVVESNAEPQNPGGSARPLVEERVAEVKDVVEEVGAGGGIEGWAGGICKIGGGGDGGGEEGSSALETGYGIAFGAIMLRESITTEAVV